MAPWLDAYFNLVQSMIECTNQLKVPFVCWYLRMSKIRHVNTNGKYEFKPDGFGVENRSNSFTTLRNIFMWIVKGLLNH